MKANHVAAYVILPCLVLISCLLLSGMNCVQAAIVPDTAIKKELEALFLNPPDINGFPYEKQLAQAAEHYNLPLPFVTAVARGESFFRPDAKSAKGAIGIMQVMPATAGDYGVSEQELLDPEKNIEKDELVVLTSSEIMKSMKSAVNKIQHQFVEYFGKKMLKPEIFLNEDIGHALKKENSINRLEIVRGVSGLSTIAGLGTAGYLTLTAGSWAAVALGAASGGATVAGIGAGLGSIAGPIGAGIGAGIGVVAGAVAGAGGAAMATATLPVAPFLIFSTLSAGACYTANSFLKKSKNSKTRTSIHQYFEDVSEKMKESLNETIDTFFRMTVKNINREVTEKIQSLERIIAEKNPEILEIEITECNAKREKLSNYSEILNGYTENAAMSG